MPVKSSDPTQLMPRQPPADGPVESRPTVVVGAPVAVEASDVPEPPEPLDVPWLRVTAWLFPASLTAALGLLGVTVPGMWEDELATWGMVTVSWREFWPVLGNIDAALGPYYLLMRVWAEVFGYSDLSLRLPSVLAMTGAAGVLAALGVRLGGLRVGVAAGTLFAVLPTTSRYAQEARPYAVTVFAAVLATLLLLRLVDKPTFGRHLAYIAAVVLLGLSHVVALLVLAGHAVIIWKLRRGNRTVVAWAIAAAAALLPVLPLLYLGQRQTGTQIGWIPPLSPQRLGETPPALFGTALMAGAVIAMALLAMSMRGPVLVATAWAVVPVLGLMAASLVTPLWVPRYLLFVVPAWTLLGSVTLRTATITRGLGAVLLMGLLAVPAQLEVRTPVGHQQGTKDIAAVLKTNSQPGDVIVYGAFANGDQRVSRDAVNRYVPRTWRPADPLIKVPPRTGGQLGGQECTDREVPSCLGKPQRVWLVRKGAMDNPVVGSGPAKEVLLKANYTVTRTWRVKGFTIGLLTRVPGK
jgi:mannosyltransferase